MNYTKQNLTSSSSSVTRSKSSFPAPSSELQALGYNILLLTTAIIRSVTSLVPDSCQLNERSSLAPKQQQICNRQFKWELFHLTSTETRMSIWDGDKGGRERKSAGANPEDRDAVDRRQNNKILRQCPLCHCTAIELPYYASAVRNSHKNNN